VAVTGSTGKTSTKDLLAAALPGAYASPRSFNNEVGVPLTVLGAPSGAGYLVVEVGSRGVGHIAWLMPAVQPDVAIVTNLGVVHLETFGTTDDLADAKFELVAALRRGGVAVLPADEPRLARSHAGHTITFGIGQGDVRADDIELDDLARPTFTLRTDRESVRVTLPLSGYHQTGNAAATAAAGVALGVPLATLAEGMAAATGSAWRMELHAGRFTVVNDAYNANPDSMEAALRTVAGMPGRHIAVLGRMAELGPVEAEEHRRIGQLVRSLGYAAVVVVGRDPGFAEGAGAVARPVPDVAAALPVVSEYVRSGDVVLVKASRSVGLEHLAHQLIEEAKP
jgi:UDP-N-acetylmuramoyl-tripeptide--D-alanyl-D-alanine ligase